MIIPVLAFALLVQQGAQPVRLKVGDVVAVYVATAEAAPFTREMTILSDGAIYGVGFGKLKVSGLTVEGAQQALRQSMRRLFREEDVFFTLLKQRTSYVYVVGTNSPGPVELSPEGLIVSQLLPPMNAETDAQRLEVQLLRDGKVVGQSSYVGALSGTNPLGKVKVQANDLISIVPQASVRVWIVGPVKTPGSVVLPSGVSIYQAVAAAGGVLSFESSTRLALRRGPETTEYPARPDGKSTGPALAEGDVVTVIAPEAIHVTIAGRVNKPDDYVVDSGTSLLQVISKAEGTTPEASLSRVFLFRGGEALQYDFTGLSNGEPVKDPKLKEGDIVYIDENRRAFYVFGHALRNGRYLMDDRRTYRATDALALAGGLEPRGSLRRVYLYRANPDGKPTITQFNLDEYLKDGKQSANPVMQPGDALLFSEPKGLTLSALSQAFNAFFLINTIRQ